MRVRGVVTTGAVIALAASAPAIADGVVAFARNADRVDGIHAVRAHEDDRAGVLVATTGEGRLPRAVMGTAPNAQRLGRHAPEDYAQTCLPGVVVGSALVPADVGPTRTRVHAWQYVRSLAHEGGLGCSLQDFLEANRVGLGVYQVEFVTGQICDGDSPPETYHTLVTVKSSEALTATSQTVCDEHGWPVEEVRIFDSEGTPRDATFTITLLTHTRPLP